MRNLQIFEYPRIAQHNRAQFADCTDSATAPNTSMSTKHSHSMFILSRGDMVKHEVGVCVHMRALCMCSEYMTDNAKNNFGETPVLDQCLKTSEYY